MTERDIEELHALALKAQAEANATNRDPASPPEAIRAANRKARIAWTLLRKAIERMEAQQQDKETPDDATPGD